ncbi:hypothetical protein RHSIM_Rhsim05G0122400 [Rhododendron simsii]|uniref:2-methoxy-6-polyprenyl-1,4-benzoquinol methylase, mitochondrial n=1 Tax=Rhododendron simsii TaxID=118357 RepID=A0A834GWT0_RHOSS|nr:hypothetical protein RHSIM_Rhsim05G0122400 [Rhododendron simsii]
MAAGGGGGVRRRWWRSAGLGCVVVGSGLVGTGGGGGDLSLLFSLYLDSPVTVFFKRNVIYCDDVILTSARMVGELSGYEVKAVEEDVMIAKPNGKISAWSLTLAKFYKLAGTRQLVGFCQNVLRWPSQQRSNVLRVSVLLQASSPIRSSSAVNPPVNSPGWMLLAVCATSYKVTSQVTLSGFKEVREEEKSQMVGNVFSSVASNYDLMNDVMSGGLHRLWKDRLVSKLNPFPGMRHLDVAGGTGDVAFRILESLNSVSRRAVQDVLQDNLQEETQIYVCDINPNMLNVGKKRAQERGLEDLRSLRWVEGDAEALCFEDASMDGYTIAFGIRNVTHIEKVLAEAYRVDNMTRVKPQEVMILCSNLPSCTQLVLKPGGRFLCLELSHVEAPEFLRYDYYSFSVIPALGELVAGDRESYQYLVESIRRFPPQDMFASMIADAGFQKVEYENLVGGVVAIHSGLKF